MLILGGPASCACGRPPKIRACVLQRFKTNPYRGGRRNTEETRRGGGRCRNYAGITRRKSSRRVLLPPSAFPERGARYVNGLTATVASSKIPPPPSSLPHSLPSLTSSPLPKRVFPPAAMMCTAFPHRQSLIFSVICHLSSVICPQSSVILLMYLCLTASECSCATSLSCCAILLSIRVRTLMSCAAGAPPPKKHKEDPPTTGAKGGMRATESM